MLCGRTPIARCAAAVGLAALWPCLALGQAKPQAQVQIQVIGGNVAEAAAAEEDEGARTVFFPADRTSLQRLDTASDLLKQQRYGEAVRFLGSLLDAPEDFFYRPDEKQSVYRSLKSEAQRLIGSMPKAGRQSYELQYGAEAQKMLDEAIERGDETLLAEVSRRFFHTQAGYAATYLLGTLQLDQQRPLSAALTLRRLTTVDDVAASLDPQLTMQMAVAYARAGMRDDALALLIGLGKRTPPVSITAGGEQRPAPANAQQAEAWLVQLAGAQHRAMQQMTSQWTMHRGNAARNAVSDGGSPLLNRRWHVPVSDDPYIELAVAGLDRSYQEQGLLALPGLFPLAVDDTIFMRSVSRLVAVDFRSGKRVWHGPVDENVRDLLEAESPTSFDNSPQVASWLDRRLWHDAAYGTMSSDGQRVYCVEDLGVDFATGTQRTVVMANGRLLNPGSEVSDFNRLVAYDIATEGKMSWEIGGRAGEFELPLAGAFFLGPPLPLGGSLYVLAEMKGEVRLFALRAEDGTEQWSQQLAVLELSIAEDTLRRTAGVSPSYADGVLVCPTSAGAVVAVDLTTRSLLWGYEYARASDPFFQRRFEFNIGGDAEDSDGWLDASATLADGHVILTPLESPDLHCLNLLTGQSAWKRPREDSLYVATLHGGQIVLVGRNGMRAYKLEDGTPAWKRELVEFPSGARPSGRGFFNGEHYYVPLTSAEVAVYDVNTGKLLNRCSSRSGTVPGNLICYRGAVVSQNVHGLESFYQLEELRDEVARRLKENPRDAAALSLRGEMLLAEGALVPAIESLRASFELEQDPRTQNLLLDALLESLRADFAANRPHMDEIEKLIAQPEQRMAFLRLVALGLQQTGEIGPAFETYLSIVRLQPDEHVLEEAGPALSVRRDRWIQTRLAELHEEADSKVRQHMEEQLQRLLDDALASTGASELQRFLTFFARFPLATVAREELSSRLIAEHRWLEAELLLRRLEHDNDKMVARRAIARLAQLLHKAERDAEAEAYYRRLGGELADVQLVDGRTGREILQDIAGERDAESLWAPVVWPRGQVNTSDEKGRPGPTYRSLTLDLRGSRNPFFEGVQIELDQPRQSLVARDGLGKEKWHVSLIERGERNAYGFNPTLSHCRVDGHLLIVSVGFQLIAIDTLGASPDEPAKVLWRHDLTEAMPGTPRHMGIHGRVINMPWGVPRFIPADPLGRPVGNTGPITADYVCFQRHRSVKAVSPLTGDTLWELRDISPGADILGDDELVFIAGQSGQEALVVSALDGSELGYRAVPPMEQRLASLGRRAVSWEVKAGRAHLTMRDLWQQEDLWTMEFSDRAKPWPLEESAIGVLEPDGKFVVINLPDGKPLIDAVVTEEPDLTEIYMFRTPERFMLITNRPWQNREGLNIQPVPGGFGNPLINGAMYGFDRRTGKLVYRTPIETHGLTLNQPGDLPVLVFASQVYETARGGRGQTPRGQLLCIDKHSGRVLYDERLSGPISTVEVSGDPADQSVSVRTLRNVLRLQYTDDEIRERPADEKEPDEDDGAAEARNKDGPDDRDTREVGAAVGAAVDPRAALKAGAEKPVEPPAEPPKRVELKGESPGE